MNNIVSVVRETSTDTVFRDVKASSRSSNSSWENEVYESDFEVHMCVSVAVAVSARQLICLR